MKSHAAKLVLRGAVCAGLLSVAAAAQWLPESALPSALPAVQQFQATDPDGSQEPAQQNKTQGAFSSDRSLTALIKRGAIDQKQIYSAPFHRRNLKWDALFLVATGGLIAADKHVTGAIPHDNLSVSQHISDAGLYSTVATTGVLLVSGILKKDERARETVSWDLKLSLTR